MWMYILIIIWVNLTLLGSTFSLLRLCTHSRVITSVRVFAAQLVQYKAGIVEDLCNL